MNLNVLKELDIDVMPATKYVANPFKIIDERYDSVIYAAEVYEFRDSWLEFVCCIFALTEQDLAKQLKDIYNCEYPYPLPKERTLHGFMDWWQNHVKGNSPTCEQYDNIIDKFKN